MHFHGSVMRDHPCATLRTVHTELKIAYDLSQELLMISAPIDCYDEDMQKHMKVVLVEENSVSFNDLKKKNKRLSLVVVWAIDISLLDAVDEPELIEDCKSNSALRSHICEVYDPSSFDLLTMTIPTSKLGNNDSTAQVIGEKQPRSSSLALLPQ